MHKIISYLVLMVASVNLFAAEGEVSQRAGVFMDSFGENPKRLTSDEAITSWLNDVIEEQLNLSPSDDIILAEEIFSINNFTIRSLQQTHQGIPIVGYRSKLILDAQGNQVGLLGMHQGFTEEAPTLSEISIEDAQSIADIETTAISPSELVYYTDDEDVLHLSWKIIGATSTGSIEEIYIDAVSGELLANYSLMQSALNRQVRNMEAACREAGVDYPIDGNRSQQIQNMSGDDRFVRYEGDAPSGVGHVDELFQILGDGYQFISNIFGMDSLDDRGLRLLGFSGSRYYADPDLPHPQCVGDEFNATWYGGGWNELHVPAIALPYVEVIAHEMGHGIVSNGSGLKYQSQSGALNEAIADAIGASFRAWQVAGGSIGSNLDSIPEFQNWWEIRKPGGVLRNMRTPQSIQGFYTYPDHFDDYLDLPVNTDNDMGGVHLNSSIINQAFYILVAGGQHPRRGTGPNVQGIGITDAIKIWVLAAHQFLTEFSDFEASRSAFAEAARVLYGGNSDQWIAVHEAMDAVGIPGTWALPPVAPPPTTPPVPMPQPDPIPSPDPIPQEPTSIPEPETEPLPTVPELVTESTDNNALYIGLGIAFVMLALFGLNRLRPEYSTTGPEYRPMAATPMPSAEPEQRINPQQVSVSRSRVAGRLVGAGTSSSIELDGSLLSSKEGLVIGRSTALNHVVLNDPRVSRRHARLRKEGQIVVLEDLNSTHGILVNGNKLQPFSKTALNKGDRIEIAGIQFTCDLNA